MKKGLILIALLSPVLSFGQDAPSNFRDAFIQYTREYKIDRSNEDGPLTPSDTIYIDFFEADSTYVVNAKVERLENSDTLTMLTVNGKKKQYIKYAYLHFELQGVQQKLMLFQSVRLMRNPLYKNYLFLPFYDESNGNTSYGGGRYIELSSMEIKGQELRLDFNRCFNPYCAYTTGYSCPIPPAENTLTVSVLAGEKAYGKDKEK